MQTRRKSHGPPIGRRLAPYSLLVVPLLACTEPVEPARDPAPAAVEPVDARSQEEALAAYRRGIEHFRSQELEAAVAEYRRAIALDPNLAQAHWALGKTLFFLSDVVFGTPTHDTATLEEATAALRRASELAPDNVEYAYWTGHACVLLGKKDEAVRYLDDALRLDPAYGPACKQLALLYMSAGDTEPAARYLKKALELMPDDAGLWFHLGTELEMEEDLQGARDAYEHSLELDWTMPRTYSRLAVVLNRLGDGEGADQAARDFQRWGAFGTDLTERLRRAQEEGADVEALLAPAELYIEAKRYDTAIVWLRRALQADPASVRARLLLADALEHTERDEEAIACFRAVLAADPTDAEARAGLERLTGERP